MAAALMQRHGLDACVVGADRVVANGRAVGRETGGILAVLVVGLHCLEGW